MFVLMSWVLLFIYIFVNYCISRVIFILQVVLSNLLIGECLICGINYESQWNFLGS